MICASWLPMENRFQTADPEVTVALQGTIETFALPDVMRLLASTKKSGCLRVEGSRGEGSVWVEGGQIVGASATGAPRAQRAVDVVFELLRFTDGSFIFEADQAPPEKGEPAEVEATLDEAEKMLEEWRAIEAVVPSLDSWVSLSAELPTDSVTLDRDRWATVVAIGGGITVGGLGEVLDLGELDVCRTVKALVEDGLVSLGEPPAGTAVGSWAPSAVVVEEETILVEETLPADGLAGAQAGVGSVSDPIAEPAEAEPYEPFDPDALIIEREPVALETEPVAGAEPPDTISEHDILPEPETVSTSTGDSEGLTDPIDAAEIARQLANLSPKAAKAVAAAAKATTQEERERALAEVDDEEEPINRELLIRFLGSVNG